MIAQILKDEKDPEILREISLFILEQSKQLAEENARIKAMRVHGEVNAQAYLSQSIAVHLHKLRRRLFATGRESLESREHERRVDVQAELLLHARSLAGDAAPVTNSRLPIEDEMHYAEISEVIGLAQKKDAEIT